MSMLSFCGLECSSCPIYLATIQDDNALRAKAVEMFGSDKYPLTVADINCFGCTSIDKPLFKFCSECEIRACATEKHLINCGHCQDYACSKLDIAFEMDKEAKGRLDKIFASFENNTLLI